MHSTHRNYITMKLSELRINAGPNCRISQLWGLKVDFSWFSFSFFFIFIWNNDHTWEFIAVCCVSLHVVVLAFSAKKLECFSKYYISDRTRKAVNRWRFDQFHSTIYWQLQQIIVAEDLQQTAQYLLTSPGLLLSLRSGAELLVSARSFKPLHCLPHRAHWDHLRSFFMQSAVSDSFLIISQNPPPAPGHNNALFACLYLPVPTSCFE